MQHSRRGPVEPQQLQPQSHSLHSNHTLNRGYAYTSIISSKRHGGLVSDLASLYNHSTPQAWQQRLSNREITVDGFTAN